MDVGFQTVRKEAPASMPRKNIDEQAGRKAAN
jgi:hypothetical protein